MEKEQFIIQSIATVGFPIVMCLVLTFLLWVVVKDHKEETTILTKAINECTLAITTLTEYIRGVKNREE